MKKKTLLIILIILFVLTGCNNEVASTDYIQGTNELMGFEVRVVTKLAYFSDEEFEIDMEITYVGEEDKDIKSYGSFHGFEIYSESGELLYSTVHTLKTQSHSFTPNEVHSFSLEDVDLELPKGEYDVYGYIVFLVGPSEIPTYCKAQVSFKMI